VSSGALNIDWINDSWLVVRRTGVDHAVGVAEDRDELVEGFQPLWHGHAVHVQHDHLEQPVRQPRDDIDGDHRQYHPCHLPSRLLLT